MWILRAEKYMFKAPRCPMTPETADECEVLQAAVIL
jgi:hypothetical protein